MSRINTELPKLRIFGIGFLAILSVISIFVLDSYTSYNDKTAELNLESQPLLTCVDRVQISLGLSGKMRLRADQFVKGGPINNDDYSVTIIDPPIGGDTIDCSFDGTTIMVQVVELNTGQTCMPLADIRDKMPPLLSCTDGLEFTCTFDFHKENRDSLLPSLRDNCTPYGDIQLTWDNIAVNRLNCASGYLFEIEREWTATDNNGMSSSCTQTFYIRRSTTADIVFPPDTIIQCGTPLSPSVVGEPTLYGQSAFLNSCDFTASVDTTVDSLHCMKKIITKEFVFMGGCGADMISHTQTIMIVDTTAPVISCPSDATVSTDMGQCEALYTIPPFTVDDDCSHEMEYRYFLNGSYRTGKTFPVGLGDNQIRIIARSSCDVFYADTCDYTLTVKDNESPQMVCQSFSITLTNTDSISYYLAKALPEIIPSDNCDNDLDVQVIREAGCGRAGNGVPNDTLIICCSDVGNPFMATFIATDDSGNKGMCMVTVTVVDNVPPVITCPPNQTISCRDLPDPSQYHTFGTVQVAENCAYTIDSKDSLTLDDCGVGKLERTFTVTDASNNVSTCTQTITITNSEVFDHSTIVFPSDITIDQCNPDLNDTITHGFPTFDNPYCIKISVNHNDMVLNGSENEACKYIARMWTVRDECTDTDYTQTQRILVRNNAAPELMVPADMTFYASQSECFINVQLANAQLSNCTSGGTITNNLTPMGPNVKYDFPVGTTEVIYTASDTCGHQTMDTTIITVLDTVKPTIVCPSNIVVPNDSGECNAYVTVPLPDVDDNCVSQGLTITNNINAVADASGTYMVGTHVIIFTVTDASNNSATCSMTVTVEDMEGPAILSCAADRNIPVNADCEYTVPDMTAEIQFDDNCEGMSGMITVTQSPVPGTIESGMITVIFTVTDTRGNSDTCHTKLSPIDTTPPIITTGPIDVTVSVDGECNHTLGDYTGDYTATDNCGNVTFTQIPAPGTVFMDVGGTDSTILIKVTDGAGLMDTVEFTLTFEDNTPPTITCPSNITVTTDPNLCTADVTIPLPTVADNCDTDPVITNNITAVADASGVYDEGTTTVIFTVTDDAGLTNRCSMTVTVNDEMAPEFVDCPLSDSIGVNANCEAIMPDYDTIVSYNDNCTSTNQITYTQNPTAGTTITGNTNVQIIITDMSGNMDTCEFLLLVRDTTPPIITTGPIDVTVNVDGDCNHTLGDYTGDYSATDNCGNVTFMQIPAPGTVFTDVGGTDTTILIKVTDGAGLMDTVEFTLTFEDNTPPTITCPSNITVTTDPNLCTADVTIPLPTVADNCDTDPEITNNITAVADASGVYDEGTTTVIFTVTDEADLTNTCSMTVTVNDEMAPEFVNCPSSDTIDVDVNCEAIMPNYDTIVSYNDNCTSTNQITYSQNPTAGTTITGNTNVQIIITDMSGNMDTCEFPLIVRDTIKPVITGDSNFDVYVDQNCNYTYGNFADSLTIIENCTYTTEQIPTPGTTVDIDTVDGVVIIIATDGNGNSDTFEITLNFIDSIPPVLVCPADTALECGIDLSNLNRYGIFDVSDQCGIDTIIENYELRNTECSTDTLVRTAIAIDKSGLRDTCTQLIFFNTNNAPLVPSDFDTDTLYFNACHNWIAKTPPANISDKCNDYSITYIDSTVIGDPNYCNSFLRRFTVVDSCNSNNSFDIFQAIYVEDNSNPILNIPADITFMIPGDSCHLFLNLGTADASDCSGIDSIRNNSPYANNNGADADGIYPAGKHFIDYTAYDGCGNSITLTQMVKVVPTELDFYCRILDTFFMDDDLYEITAREEIKFVSPPPCGSIGQEYTISFTKDDINDTIRYIGCDSLENNVYHYAETVYINFEGCTIDSCMIEYEVFDILNFCPDMAQGLAGNVKHWNGIDIGNVELTERNTESTDVSDGDGDYLIQANPSNLGKYVIHGEMDDDPLKGLSTYDLYLIHQHLLGINKITNPYKLLAADVNMDRKISSKDLVTLRRLLLEIDTEFNDEKEWLFVPDYVKEFEIFENGVVEDDFDYRFNYVIKTPNGTYDGANFIGLKKGDINGSTELPSGFVKSETRSTAFINYTISENEVVFSPYNLNRLGAFQVNLELNGAEMLDIESQLPGFSENNYRIIGNRLIISYVSDLELELSVNDALFKIHLGSHDQDVEIYALSEGIESETYVGNEISAIKFHEKVEKYLEYALYTNKPNPFEMETVISYMIPTDENVEFNIYNSAGHKVMSKTIESNAGYNEVIIRNDDLGSQGIYYYQINCEEFTAIKKMVLVR